MINDIAATNKAPQKVQMGVTKSGNNNATSKIGNTLSCNI